MEAIEQIKKWGELLETEYRSELNANIRKGYYFLVVNFSDIVKFDSDLAEEILDKPEDGIKAAEIAVHELIDKKIKKFNIRLRNIPKSQRVLIRDIRSQHLNKLLVVEGVIRQKSDVRPQVTSAKFECPSCGNIINVLQLDASFNEPSKCGCGRKGKFRLLSKELIDVQGIVLEEIPEQLEGGAQPKRINIFLKDDLVSPISEKKTNPGSRMMVVGLVKEVPITLRSGAKSVRFDLLIEANYLEPTETDFYDLVIKEEEIKKIQELANDKEVYKKIVDSLAPTIYGYEKVKEALLLQLVGGVRKENKDGASTRGDMHILLVGDPGSGKSQLLKRIQKIAPKGRYVSGKGVSGAGLTASVVKDEFLKGWSLEAGALVLASDGLCCIDEMDKMSNEDRNAMHEALEQQTVSIAKANIQATLICRTTVLAAANPKLGRFDPYDILAKQIDMPPTLINRFDLIFPIKDLPDKDKDDKLASYILELHKNPDFQKPLIDTDFLKKFIAYARQNSRPVLTEGAIEEIKNYYVDMRNSGGDEKNKPIPMSARQLEGLVRLSEASAKIRLSDKVTRKDAKRAIELLHYCLSQIGIDPETGKIDIDRITTGITSSERSKIITIRELIAELENKIGKTIPIEDVIKEGVEQGLSEGEIEDAIEKLKRTGDLFEPKMGFIQRI